MILNLVYIFFIALTSVLIDRFYPKKFDKELKWPVWAFGSLFWPIALPLMLFTMGINKVFDKFTKV